MKLRGLYGNTSHTGHSIDFFELAAPGARDALLASPFYDTYKPVQILTQGMPGSAFGAAEQCDDAQRFTTRRKRSQGYGSIFHWSAVPRKTLRG
ncbi:hypothetical protein LZK76_02855 [Rhizobium leguminosarum]|nr:hypothetical protein LZK76_02855 [Rhizobium leguminosarum]